MSGRKCNLPGNEKLKTDNSSKIYIGLSANQLKKRIATHNTTIISKPNDKNYIQYNQATELSKLTQIKKLKQELLINFENTKKGKQSKPGTIRCRLCLKKLY